MPYGLALMILRGSTADLIDALAKKDSTRILLCIMRIQKAKSDFSFSRIDNYDSSSYVHRTYNTLEESSVVEANLILASAHSFLQDSLIVI